MPVSQSRTTAWTTCLSRGPACFGARVPPKPCTTEPHSPDTSAHVPRLLPALHAARHGTGALPAPPSPGTPFPSPPLEGDFPHLKPGHQAPGSSPPTAPPPASPPGAPPSASSSTGSAPLEHRCGHRGTTSPSELLGGRGRDCTVSLRVPSPAQEMALSGCCHPSMARAP